MGKLVTQLSVQPGYDERHFFSSVDRKGDAFEYEWETFTIGKVDIVELDLAVLGP